MAKNNVVKKIKNLETVSLWFAISNLLIFFANLIAFVAILVLGNKEDSKVFSDQIFNLTVITEFISLVCFLTWIVLAIIQMVIIGKNKELGKYHHGSFVLWILAMIISIGFIFLSLLIFFVSIQNEWSKWGVYISFSLYFAATTGSILYIASVSRSLRKIKYDLQ